MARASAARLPARMPSTKFWTSSGRGGSRDRTGRPAGDCIGIFIKGLLAEPFGGVIQAAHRNPGTHCGPPPLAHRLGTRIAESMPLSWLTTINLVYPRPALAVLFRWG